MCQSARIHCRSPRHVRCRCSKVRREPQCNGLYTLSEYVGEQVQLVKLKADTSTVFTKLASQLTTDRLVDLAVIPFIFAAQTLVSYMCSVGVSMLFRFKKRPRNFVVAMGVSDSLSVLDE